MKVNIKVVGLILQVAVPAIIEIIKALRELKKNEKPAASTEGCHENK
jgi:hypothetical protein